MKIKERSKQDQTRWQQDQSKFQTKQKQMQDQSKVTSKIKAGSRQDQIKFKAR